MGGVANGAAMALVGFLVAGPDSLLGAAAAQVWCVWAGIFFSSSGKVEREGREKRGGKD